jgi:hypothetical protein
MQVSLPIEEQSTLLITILNDPEKFRKMIAELQSRLWALEERAEKLLKRKQEIDAREKRLERHVAALKNC